MTYQYGQERIGGRTIMENYTGKPYQIWGRELIDQPSIDQMNNAISLPISVAGALMPDAHLGYGLPIGGVLATVKAVIPYAVGVDIACRVCMSIYPADPELLVEEPERLIQCLQRSTRFGVGAHWAPPKNHPVLDDPLWDSTSLLRDLHRTAVTQLGTSGAGNHFADFGLLEVHQEHPGVPLTKGKYIALLTHSGSRKVGHAICTHYSQIARTIRHDLPKPLQHLSWLSMDSKEGEEYWQAMELAGRFSAANHTIIHDQIAQCLGWKSLHRIENHHNFAWKERWQGQKVILHRKGATPANQDAIGIIPGSMADPAFVVRGLGNEQSLNSAAHGAGRQMSRKSAKATISIQERAAYLKKKGVHLIQAGIDEAPQAYKSISEIMASQQDLVEIMGRFHPKIVLMAREKGAI